jgi:RNA polymerase sigma-70 factor (ECF subfamily)
VASPDEALERMVVSPDDPELLPLKETYHAQFREAFLGALASLEPRERTVLLQHYLDGLNIEQIGALYRVHRATIARWIARTREALLERTREALMRTLRLSEPEYESLMRLIGSRMAITLRSLLAPEGGGSTGGADGA